MQRKKNIRLMLLLAVLVTATVVLFVTGGCEGSDVDPDYFQLTDYTGIDRVVLQSPRENIVLSYNGARWRLNDSLVADRAMIDVLFATLAQVRVRRALGADSVAAELETRGVKVILQKEGTVVQEFIAGGNDRKTLAYFMKPGERKPFVMHIPGYRVYASGIFELESGGWRDKYVFGFDWQNFSQLNATFPDRPTDNFEVYLEDRVAHIRGMNQADTTRLNTFLDAVSMLTVDQFISTPAGEPQTPLMTILVTDIGRRSYELSLFPGGPGDGPYEGLFQRRDRCTFSPRRLEEVIRRRGYFQAK